MAATEADVSSTSNSRIPPEQLEQNRKDGESDDPTLSSLLEYFGDYRSEMVVQIYFPCWSDRLKVETGDAKSMVFHYFPLFLYVNAFTFQQIPASNDFWLSDLVLGRVCGKFI
ncbi:hypothetical protein YC2023_118685 [Brassica napus]